MLKVTLTPVDWRKVREEAGADPVKRRAVVERIEAAKREAIYRLNREILDKVTG